MDTRSQRSYNRKSQEIILRKYTEQDNDSNKMSFFGFFLYSYWKNCDIPTG